MVSFNGRTLDLREVDLLRDVLEYFIQEYENISRYEDDVQLAKKLLDECN